MCWLRDKNGIGKAKFDESVEKFAQIYPGHKVGNYYVIDEDMVLEPVKGCRIFLWKGDVISPS